MPIGPTLQLQRTARHVYRQQESPAASRCGGTSYSHREDVSHSKFCDELLHITELHGVEASTFGSRDLVRTIVDEEDT